MCYFYVNSAHANLPLMSVPKYDYSIHANCQRLAHGGSERALRSKEVNNCTGTERGREIERERLGVSLPHKGLPGRPGNGV